MAQLKKIKILLEVPWSNSRDYYHIPTYWDIGDLLNAFLSFHPYVSSLVRTSGNNLLPQHHKIQNDDVILLFETGCRGGGKLPGDIIAVMNFLKSPQVCESVLLFSLAPKKLPLFD